MKLKDSVYNAVINLHKKTKKEWISLKEIYEEVERETGEPLKNGGASVRAIIEKHCSSSDVFDGDELYISKELRSGLYKAVSYDGYKTIDSLTIGDVFSREQLMDIFKISGQSGIMKTNTYQSLVLTTSEFNGVYNDGILENGRILYTGEGLIGDQTITKNNKTIYESRETGIPMYLFSKDKKRRYTFEGRVELYDDPYQKEEEDSNGNTRLVWKFPLKIVSYADNDLLDNDNYSNLVYEIIELENKIDSDYFIDDVNLEYREGPINIRKHRKTGRKIQRNGKPDFIADEIVKSKQGVINERVVYENELRKLIEAEANEQVKKMEEFFLNKKENEGYDVLSFELDDQGNYIEKYIEVKSTKSDERTPIDITADEIEFAMNHLDNYYIYRIVNSDSENRYFKIIKGRDLFNDDIYNFVPTSYKIYSN